MTYIYFYDFPIGKVGIAETDGAISHIFFNDTTNKPPKTAELQQTPLLQRAAAQLREYFDGKRTEFDLPISCVGTEFQMSVWQALQEIPYGKTCSYKDIAEKIGNPKACRAVGLANNRNPISIIVPCHRVVGHSGKLVGYGGGLLIKEYLLELEQRTKLSIL